MNWILVDGNKWSWVLMSTFSAWCDLHESCWTNAFSRVYWTNAIHPHIPFFWIWFELGKNTQSDSTPYLPSQLLAYKKTTSQLPHYFICPDSSSTPLLPAHHFCCLFRSTFPLWQLGHQSVHSNSSQHPIWRVTIPAGTAESLCILWYKYLQDSVPERRNIL